MMAKLSCEMPESRNKARTSRCLTLFLFIKYSLSPDRKIRRVTITWSSLKLSSPFLLSKIRETSAWLAGLRNSLPANITSFMFEPRKDLALDSPITHLIASVILLLPLPLGPTMPVIPVSNSIFVFSAKDLKPSIISSVSGTHSSP